MVALVGGLKELYSYPQSLDSLATHLKTAETLLLPKPCCVLGEGELMEGFLPLPALTLLYPGAALYTN